MEKKTMHWIIGWGILLILYIIVTFFSPFVYTVTFWISSIFNIIAFCVVTALVGYTCVNKYETKSRFYGFSITKIAVIYGMGQLIASVIFRAFSADIPVWVVVLAYVIIFLGAASGLISAKVVINEIPNQEMILKKDVSLMRSMQSKISWIALQSENADIKVLAEEFRYSDPVSNEAIVDAETELSAVVDELQAAFVDEDEDAVLQLCHKVSALLNERNRLCKLNKN